ncbi:MAG: hypothetical protein AAF205_10915 [Pseudomonadota bacterium]
MNDEELRTGEEKSAAELSSRRRVLKLGAVAVPAVATLTPSMAMAQGGGAAVSLLNCTIPIPAKVGKDGIPVPEHKLSEIFVKNGKEYYRNDNNKRIRVFNGPVGNTAVHGAGYTGQQIKDSADRGWSPPYDANVSRKQFQAHLKYIQKVRSGSVPGAGLTCLVSLSANLHTV